VIEVRDAHVRYGDNIALNGASVTVDAGTVTGLIGMNGAGKSTLFNAIMGEVPLTHGSILIDGHTPAQARKQNLIAYVPQAEAVDWSFPVSVRDVVMMGRYGYLGPARRARPIDREAIDVALERTGLSELADRQIGQLSGGQRKRVFVARGIAQEARVMLLDEPFAGVDTTTSRALGSVLSELADEGRTVFVSTHDLAALPQLASEVVLLFRRVVASGPPDKVLTPENLAVAFGMRPGGEG
jgi:manganese transport system ATP-binding protein